MAPLAALPEETLAGELATCYPATRPKSEARTLVDNFVRPSHFHPIRFDGIWSPLFTLLAELATCPAGSHLAGLRAMPQSAVESNI